MPLGTVLHGLTGALVLAVVAATGELASIGGILGMLLLTSAFARYFRARGA